MKIDKRKLDLACARACKNMPEVLAAAGLSRGVYCNIIRGKGVACRSAGLIARALDVDVSELLEDK